MKNKEAIKMLKTILRTVYLGNRKFNESIQMAMSALEKQEADRWHQLSINLASTSKQLRSNFEATS